MPDENDTAREEVEDLSDSVSRGPRSEAVLTVLRGANPGALYTMGGSEAIIGRSPDVAVAIPDDTLSRQHARIRRIVTGFVIDDLGSTNGTFVDGVRVSNTRMLDDGCRIHLGTRTVLHFRLHDAVELEAVQRAHDLTVRDPLTGTFNRRHLEEHLQNEAAYSRRHRTPLSLLLLDVDHFKQINDEHGHAVGDEVLRLLAEAMGTLTREEDMLARFGGEEFALIARGIDEESAMQLAERIRNRVAALSLSSATGQVRFTVSIGIAHSEDGQDALPQRMFEAADRALYAAKDAGRNRVSLAPAKD